MNDEELRVIVIFVASLTFSRKMNFSWIFSFFGKSNIVVYHLIKGGSKDPNLKQLSPSLSYAVHSVFLSRSRVGTPFETSFLWRLFQKLLQKGTLSRKQLTFSSITFSIGGNYSVSWMRPISDCKVKKSKSILAVLDFTDDLLLFWSNQWRFRIWEKGSSSAGD